MLLKLKGYIELVERTGKAIVYPEKKQFLVKEYFHLQVHII